MTEPTKGVLALIATSTIWGLSGIYYKLIAHVPPLEVLAHRTIWSLVFFLIVLGVQGRLGEASQGLRVRRTLGILLISALMISINWLVFITAIQQGYATEASLGYYIFPLVAVLLGYLFLGERFRNLQKIAIAFAVLAVAILTIGLGAAPWVALILATTFGIYGMTKRQVPLGPVVSVLGEVCLLLPLALGYVAYIHMNDAAIFGDNLKDTLLLAFSGVLTGLPLVLFSYGSKRLTYASVGLVQYLNPTLQFLVAVLVFSEAFSRWHAIAFPLIWFGLAIYSWDTWRRERASRNKKPRQRG